MTYHDNYDELIGSQLPALQLLIALGWQYLPPDEINRLRGGRRGAVVLEGVLSDWLRTHNGYDYHGQRRAFSAASIEKALRDLKDVPPGRGLVLSSMNVYERLTLGTDSEETNDGDKRGYSLQYIDWQNPAANVYHVTDEFSVERDSRTPDARTRRPDIVLFVNGIPLAVIECKRSDLETAEGSIVEQAISQTIRNQKTGEIPSLFLYTQLLIAAQPNEVRYGTTGTGKDFWAAWHEESQDEAEVSRLINSPLNATDAAGLYDHRLNPARLLELAYGYVVYDNAIKKIVRHQQYFAVRETLARVEHLNAQNARTGGLIWHTTGAGKSLTMVMLGKALALSPSISNPRVVIVTDRVDLDDQIWRTFKACGKTVVKAGSGKDLAEFIREPRNEIITTVIDKFEAAARLISDPNPDVFVLVDESHRGQYGTNAAKMRAVFPNGCYIGFTGTPLLKKEQVTAQKFGGFIHKYTMRQAVEDKAVLRLLYDGRYVDLDVNREQLDTWFERRTQTLTEAQKTDLKRKMSRAEEVSQVQARLAMIAYDIAEHYKKTFRGTGLKGQLATSSKETAIRYLKLLEDEGINCAVIMSPPDEREGNDEIDEAEAAPVQAFWRQMMTRYGDEKRYNGELIRSFSEPDGVELLIVVDKLLVGFDEPRNTVLYIDKTLREHGLLQAIARVNRLCVGKDYGHIVDYRGVLGELDAAMQTYNALEAFDPEDVADTVIDASVIIESLPGLHSAVWNVFNDVLRENEAMERHLEPEDRRHDFYDALSAYARALKVALSTVAFFERVAERQINTHKRDLAFFHKLRTAVKLRYAEAVDYGDYETRIRKLLNEHINANEIAVIVEKLDIFNAEQFDQAVAQLESEAARADTIANHSRQEITGRMEENPAFYRRLSQMVEETIRAYRENRLSEREYLEAMGRLRDELRAGEDQANPEQLSRYRNAGAYFGVLNEVLGEAAADKRTQLIDLAIVFEQEIERHKVIDWGSNIDVVRAIKNTLDDCLYEQERQHGLVLTSVQRDLIIENMLRVAQRRG